LQIVLERESSDFLANNNEVNILFFYYILDFYHFSYKTLPSAKKNPHFVLHYINENGETLDMIGFYNQFFIKEMKKYVLNLKNSSTPQIFAVPRPMIPSLITDSPLKLFSNTNNSFGKSINNFASPLRKLSVDPNMTPFSAALYIRDEDDDLRKIFKNDVENSVKILDFSGNHPIEKPNNLLLTKIKSRYEGFQANLHLKSNTKLLLNEGKNDGGKCLKRNLFEDGGNIEEMEENTSLNEK